MGAAGGASGAATGIAATAAKLAGGGGGGGAKPAAASTATAAGGSGAAAAGSGATTGGSGAAATDAAISTGAAVASGASACGGFTARKCGVGVGARFGAGGGVATRRGPACGAVEVEGVATGGEAGGVTARNVCEEGRGTPTAGVGARRGGCGCGCSGSAAFATGGLEAAGGGAAAPSTTRQLASGWVRSRVALWGAAFVAGGPSSSFQPPPLWPTGSWLAAANAARTAGPSARARRFLCAGSAGGGCDGCWLGAPLKICLVGSVAIAGAGAEGRQAIPFNVTAPRPASEASLSLRRRLFGAPTGGVIGRGEHE